MLVNCGKFHATARRKDRNFIPAEQSPINIIKHRKHPMRLSVVQAPSMFYRHLKLFMTMKNYILRAVLSLFCFGAINLAFNQTNPAPQSLPYSQDFSGLAHGSTTYPDGWQGWTISTSPGASFNTSAPTADRALTASSTAATTSGNVHNYNGEIGFLNSGTLDLSIVLSLNTTGSSNVLFEYDVMTIRNPYDGGTNTRINEVILQYRIGTTGAFTNITGTEYQNNTTTQTIAVTTPQNLQNISLTLPSACNNEAVVQLRIVSRQVSGGGSRPSFALDNISVSATPITTLSLTPTELSNLTYIEGFGPSANQTLNVSGNNLTSNITLTAPTNFEISTNASSGFTSVLNLTPSSGSVPSTTIYVRLVAGLVANSYSGTLSATTTGASTQNVSVSGSVSIAPPILTAIGVPYLENFNSFNSAATLPNGWAFSSTGSVNAYQGDWGSGTAGGLRGNANVLGYQHTASSGIATKTLTLLNDIGTNINQLEVSYLGRVSRTTELRHPAFTFSINGVPVPELAYSTASGNDETITITITGLNIPNGATFTLSWASDRGFNISSGSSRQIGLSDVRVVVPTVITGALTGAPFVMSECSATQTGTISYTVGATLNPGNIFSAELSDANGNFASPLNIGNLTSTTDGLIEITIPENLQSGSGYRIRVVSSNPVGIGTQSAAFIITQNGQYCPQIGDFETRETGNWTAIGTWNTYNYIPASQTRAWQNAVSEPNTANTNVYIRSGHTVTLNLGPRSINNLFIENGARLFRNSSSCSAAYLNLSGDIICNGDFGNGETPDALDLNIQAGSHRIQGNGSFNGWRIRLSDDSSNGSVLGNAALEIDINIVLRYEASCGGSNAIYSNRNAASTFDVVVNSGKTLTISDTGASIGMDGSNTTPNNFLSSNRGGGYTVFGTIDCAGRYMLGSNNPIAQQTYMIIKNGGLVKVGYLDYGDNNVAQGGRLTVEDGGKLEINNADLSSNTWVNTGVGSIQFDIQSGSTIEYNSTVNQNTIGNLFNYYNLIKNGTGNLTLTTNLITTNELNLQNGIVITGSNTLSVTNNSTSAILNGLNTGTTRFIQGRLLRATDNGIYNFPIGFTGYGAQGFSIDVTGAGDVLGFLEANDTPPLRGFAYCDLETPTAVGQQIGEGNPTPDGILDQIQFDLSSPLQWKVTNPGAGITAYNITVNANGSNDISPAISGSTAIRYLLKNGEPGNTGVPTGNTPEFPEIGFMACPNGYTLSGMTGFSAFTINGASPSNTALPVELLFFTAQVNQQNIVVLNWATASELNNDFYTVERSLDGLSWELVDIVNGSGTTPLRNDYSTRDLRPYSGLSYYRLKQTDFDGTFEYSNIVSVFVNAAEKELIKVVNILGQTVDINTPGLVILVFSNGESLKMINE
jgi:hypothetical protein